MKSKPDLGDTVLLLEGLDSYHLGQSTNTKRRGHNMKCVRRKTVYDRYGRPVKRCAKFSGVGSSGLKTNPKRPRRRSLFGQAGPRGKGLLADMQPVLVTGGLTAVGAWASQSLSARIGESLKVQPGSMFSSLLTILIGVIGGGVVGRATGRRDFGVAISVGAVVVTALNFLGSLTPPTKTAGWGVITAEPAPYFQPASMPPLAAFPSVSNLYTDIGNMAAYV